MSRSGAGSPRRPRALGQYRFPRLARRSLSHVGAANGHGAETGGCDIDRLREIDRDRARSTGCVAAISIRAVRARSVASAMTIAVLARPAASTIVCAAVIAIAICCASKDDERETRRRRRLRSRCSRDLLRMRRRGRRVGLLRDRERRLSPKRDCSILDLRT
jgi:hypothetical protein